MATEPEPTEVRLIRELEEQLLRPEVRASADQVTALIADEFIEFGASGRTYDKKQIVELLRNEQGRGSPPTVEDFRVRRLAADVVLATYRIVEGETLRSSIWKFMNGRWQMVFHQGTKSPSP